MDDGVSINVATSAITAVGGGGLGALLVRWFGWFGGGQRTKELEARIKELEKDDARQRTKDLEARVNELEKNDARQTALLESIDKRLETLTRIFMEAHGGVK